MIKSPAKPVIGRIVRKAPLRFYVEDYARPSAGAALFAYTRAWMELTNIDKVAVPHERVVRIAGQRAVKYHTDNGNFERTPKGLILSAKGKRFFAARDAKELMDPEAHAAYVETMTRGRTNIFVSDKHAVIPV